MSMGELGLPFVYHSMTWMRERCHLHTPYSLPPLADRSASPKVIRVRQQTLYLT